MVTDPLGNYDTNLLRKCFQDVVYPYKEHFIVDLQYPLNSMMSSHNSKYARKTLKVNTLVYCRKNKKKKIIFAQSHSDVAGYWNTGEYIKDDSSRKLNFKGDHAIYIISKCAAVDLIEHYHQQYGVQNIVLRLPTIYCYLPDSMFYVNGEKKEKAYLSFIKKSIKRSGLCCALSVY